MSFGAPFALFALFSLLVPLGIHLWRARKGKVQAVGNIQLLRSLVTRKARPRRLEQWVLLVLRTLLLAFLSLLLAQPYSTKPVFSENAPGFILFPLSLWEAVQDQKGELLDSLQKQGYRVHAFEPGFKAVALDTLASTEGQGGAGIPYSSLFRALVKKIPEGQSAFVFTDKRIETLGQEFPVLPASIQWQLLSFPLDSQTWQAHGIRGVLEGQSNSRRTSFKQIENRRDSLTLLLAGTHPEELIPLKAGLTSLAEEMEIPLLLLDGTAASSFPTSSKKASWGIWLKQEPISEDFLAALAPEAPVLTRTLDRQSSAAAEAFIPLFGAGQGNLPLPKEKRSGPVADSKTPKRWEDAFGNPLMHGEEKNGRKYHALPLGLDAHSSEWTRSPAFLRFLQYFFFEAPTQKEEAPNPVLDAGRDLRTWPESSMLGRVPADSLFALQGENSPLPADRQPVSFYFWLLACLVFLLERAMSYYFFRKERRETLGF